MQIPDFSDVHFIPPDEEMEDLLDDLEALIAEGAGDAAERAEAQQILATLRAVETP